MRVALHVANVFLLLALIGCIAGALAGLIVLAPFVAGAWGLNLTAILTYDSDHRADLRPAHRTFPSRASSPGDAPAGGTTPETAPPLELP